jgi:hypothetical protein
LGLSLDVDIIVVGADGGKFAAWSGARSRFRKRHPSLTYSLSTTRHRAALRQDRRARYVPRCIRTRIRLHRAAREEHDGVIHSDYTILTTARDLQALKYYWKTYDDQTIRSVDLNALDPNAKATLRVSTSGQHPVVDTTRAMK